MSHDSVRMNEQDAVLIATEALAEARRLGHRPMAVVVVDAAAQVLASVREAQATALRLDIALGKAAAAIGMGASTRVLAARAAELPVFFGAVSSVATVPFVAQTGAVLIRSVDGRVLGAVGASGGTGDEDERICIAGIAAAGLQHG